MALSPDYPIPSNKEFVFVPDRLPPGVNILHQPPFDWLLANEKIFPNDFFTDPEHGEPLFMQALLHYKTIQEAEGVFRWVRGKMYWEPWRYHSRRGPIDFSDYPGPRVWPFINQPYQKDDVLNYACSRAIDYLKPYDFWADYLQYKWIAEIHAWLGGAYDELGKPTERGLQQPAPTYAAFAVEQRKYFRNTQLYGLAEVLPEGFAPPETVTDALPAKGPFNRWYRLVRASEAMR